jgi:predicted GTPase
MSEPTINVQETVNEAIEKALKSRGIANVLIAGKTGVGKSTLVNAVFQGRMAETGQGRPVTQHTRRISKEGVPVSIYDTKGLEIKDYKPILEELLAFIKVQNSQQDPQAHIHVAWLCIAEGSRRVEDAELNLVKQLAIHIPVIAND